MQRGGGVGGGSTDMSSCRIWGEGGGDGGPAAGEAQLGGGIPSHSWRGTGVMGGGGEGGRGGGV